MGRFKAEADKAEMSYCDAKEARVGARDAFNDCADYDACFEAHGCAVAEYLKLPAFGWFEGEEAFVFSFPRGGESRVKVIQVDRGCREGYIDVNEEQVLIL